MDNTLDIVNLINKNPLTKLSNNYQHNLLNKIKDTFTEAQQQLFVGSFYTFLNHDTKNDFIISLDNVWKWCGFSRKEEAKRLLSKQFTIDIDYKIVLRQAAENLNGGGRPKEEIKMTINTFKKFCLKAGTKKADEIHDYYIKLEELLHETLKEEAEELRNQLLIKDHNFKLQRHNILIEILKNKECVYLGEIEQGLIKIGSSTNIDIRVQGLNRLFGNITLLDVFECDKFRNIEHDILHHPQVLKHMHKDAVNNHNSKEVVKLSSEFTYNHLLNITKNIIQNNKFLTPQQIIETKKLDLENKKLEIIEKIINLGYNPELLTTLTKQISEYSFNLNINNNNNNNNIPNEQINSVNKNIQDKIIQDKIIQDNYNKTGKVNGKKPKGRKIQQIDPLNFKIIKIHDSMVYLLRDPTCITFQKSGIQNAVKKNYIYKGYRWNFVNPGENPNVVNIKDTVEFKNKVPNIETIVELNTDKSKILDTYATVNIIANKLGIAKTKMRKIIETSEKINNNYYVKISNCPIELLKNYNKPINKVISPHSKKIKQINPISKEVVIFDSLSDVYIKYGISSLTLIKVIQEKCIYQGSLWEYA
jgi:phage anti-repressor protein